MRFLFDTRSTLLILSIRIGDTYDWNRENAILHLIDLSQSLHTEKNIIFMEINKFGIKI